MFSLHSPAIGVDWYTATFLGSLFLLLAGFFDVVDGAVARVTKRTSALGGYLDSVLDKVSEIIIFVGILIGSFTNPVLVLVALSLSLLVSYTRARGEGLGVDLKGKGIAERAERILIIVILGFIPFQENISVALWLISILAAITVLERLKVVSTKFGTPLFSLQTFKDMSRRNHEYEGSAGTNTSRLNEPPTSLSKITRNVNDYLDKPDSKTNVKSRQIFQIIIIINNNHSIITTTNYNFNLNLNNNQSSTTTTTTTTNYNFNLNLNLNLNLNNNQTSTTTTTTTTNAVSSKSSIPGSD